MKNRNHRNPERGQTMIESSLVIIILLVTLLGIIDFGQVLFFHQTLVERARAGVRWAAVNYTLNPGPPETFTLDTTAVENVVIYNDSTGAGTPILAELTHDRVDVALTGNPGCDNTRITVTIREYPFQFFTPYLAQTFVNKPIVETMSWEAPVPKGGTCPSV